ncbi:putative ABC transport system ATP-binding protein [Humitalea rosea]|uniref:Putative ABC transport system ATP-binding protein n=1 Tax=Humitalea rosea TaxID=990373 RepID=A0A2W7J606_9PROT|nr:ATP-binding cassette domain-containing protein [Humitalea rosea]PZW46562.1 putative ABC transport system ATP-binding protein [Humitalea rosea]
MTAALRLRGVVARRRSGNAVFSLDIPALTLPEGGLVAVTGASGTGKSTLLDVAALAARPETAAVLEVAGTDAAILWRRGRLEALAALRGASFGYVLQTGGLIPFLSLRDNARLAQDFSGRRDEARITRLAEALEIGELLGRLPAALSVGQRQRAAILRALAHRPSVVIADEPTASVHPDMAETILALLAEQAREAGAAVLLATHDAAAAARHGFALAPLLPVPGEAASVLAEPVLA